MGKITLANESGAPATPVGGAIIYALDGKLYYKDSTGVAAEILAGAIVATEIAADAVETAKIKDLNVTAGKLAADAVETAKIKDLNVTEGKIADDAVTNAKLANIPRGSIIIGGTANAPTYLSAAGSGHIVVGNGTDLLAVLISGDATLAANGALTIAANAITDTKIADNVIGANYAPGTDLTLEAASDAVVDAVADIVTINAILSQLLAIIETGTLDGALWLSVTSFTQSSSAEQLTNGDFETGSPPTGWTAFANAQLSAENDPRPGSAGSKALAVIRAGTANPYAYRTYTSSPNTFIEMIGWFRHTAPNMLAISISLYDADLAVVIPEPTYGYADTNWHQVGGIRRIRTNPSIRLTARPTVDGVGAHFDDVSLKYLTLNAQQTGPSNAIVDVTFTLPSTTWAGQQLLIPFRIKNTLATEYNCWQACFWRNKDNEYWDFDLYYVTDGVTTTVFRTAANGGIGTPDMLRVKYHGTQVQLFTREGAGDWIPRSPIANVDHMTTERGVNVISSSGFTITQMDIRLTTAFGSGLFGEKTFLVMGDSKSVTGQWDFQYKHYAELASGKLWTMVDNFAVGGWTVHSAMANFAADVAAMTSDVIPEYILINLGANDISSTTEANLKSYYGTLLADIHAEWPDAQCYLMRPWQVSEPTRSDTFAGWIADLVALNPTFCSLGPDERVFLENSDGGATYMRDDKHPNPAGYLKTAQMWVELLNA